MLFFRLRQPIYGLFDSKRNLIFLSTFLLIFPKGGIKLAGVPITWGYLLLSIFSVIVLLRQPIFIHKDRFSTFIGLLPFQIIAGMTMALNGIDNYPMAISFWISLFFLPFVFLVLFSKDIDTFDDQKFFRFFKNGILFIAMYGIFLFAFKQITGRFLEIPFLTTNLGDLGLLEEKHINRGIVFKLISTYNNGNIYGICLLMLLPLYCFLEKKCWCRAIVKFSLFFTFSRTVWIGLLFYELCFTWVFTKNRKKKILIIAGIFSLFSSLIGAICFYFKFPLNFLFDLNFGGRKDTFILFTETGLLSTNPFGGIHEVIYAGIMYSFGLLGLLFFLAAVTGPLFYQLLCKKLSPIHKCIGIGLCNYLLISMSDGALLYLPTLSFFWFLYSLLYRKNFSVSADDNSLTSPLLPLPKYY